MKRLRIDPVQIPPHTNGAATGTAYDIKFFPDSKPGLNGPFVVPAKPPIEPIPGKNNAPAHTAGYFQAWVDYFVNLVGSNLERLNGHQFNLDKGRTSRAKKMSKLLGDVSAVLSGKSSPPQSLDWPLAGDHTFIWAAKDAKAIGYDTFTIKAYFEAESDYRMVVNCSVEVLATDAPIQPLSSSSSYLATSSSG